MQHDDSDTETPSLRAEQGKPAVPDAEPSSADLTVGSMLRGPIGREGAPPDQPASEGAEADRAAAETREEKAPRG